MRRTHKGLMYGIVPCYFDFTNEECPEVEGRFLGCDLLCDVVEIIFSAFCFVATFLNPDYEPLFPIKLTGTLDWDGGDIGE